MAGGSGIGRWRRSETKLGERASKRQRTVQSGGTRGARKAVVCRGPPHWHTVVRYDPLRTSLRTEPLTVISEVTFRLVLVCSRLGSWPRRKRCDAAINYAFSAPRRGEVPRLILNRRGSERDEPRGGGGGREAIEARGDDKIVNGCLLDLTSKQKSKPIAGRNVWNR